MDSKLPKKLNNETIKIGLQLLAQFIKVENKFQKKSTNQSGIEK
jgi:hypothetical protein